MKIQIDYCWNDSKDYFVEINPENFNKHFPIFEVQKEVVEKWIKIIDDYKALQVLLSRYNENQDS